MRNTLFGGFKHRYPQNFLDDLAKAMGIEWTKAEFKTVSSEDVIVRPLSPPSDILYFLEPKYTTQKSQDDET